MNGEHIANGRGSTEPWEKSAVNMGL